MKEEHSNYWTVFITLATAVSLVLLTLIFFVKYPGAFNFFDRYQSKSLIHPSKIFVGREQEMSKLMDLLDFSSDTDVRIVNIVGSPGFGKSTLAVHVGDQMVKQGVEVHYINMDEYQGGQDIDTHIELAEKILKAADYSSDRYRFDDLIKWLRNLFWNSLIILDDCDDLVHNNNETKFFLSLKKMVEQTPRAKVLITSREVTNPLEYFKWYRINQLNKRASCELFEQILPVGANLTTTEIEEIAELTGNAPLALQIVGALLSSPNPPSPSYIIDELNSHPITLLSHEDLQHEDKLNVSISLSYRYLSREMQTISQYLANFPGSFTLEAANAIVICGLAPCLENASQNDSSVTKTLRSLTSRSLIEFNLIKKQRYTFHRLIMEFFREMQVSHSNKAKFNSNFQSYYSSLLKRTIKECEVDYEVGLHSLKIDRHNYQHILNDLKTKNHDVAPFLDMIASVAEALTSTVQFLSTFSDEEVMDSTLSALEYIEENHLLQQESLRFAYVTLLYEVIRIKKHVFGIEDALETYTERESVVDSVTANEANAQLPEKKVFEQLIRLHEELENRDKATNSHIQFLSLVKYDFKCKEMRSQCSYFEIGEEYYSIEFYKQAAQYLELAYQHENMTIMNRFYLLVDLAVLNTKLHQKSKVEKYSQELHSILQDDSLTASEIYWHRSTLTAKIRNLQRSYLPDIGNDLEMKLAEVVLDVDFHANSTKCSQQNDSETLNVLEHFYEQMKYNKTIQLGEILLNRLKTCSKQSSVIDQAPLIRAELLVAKSIFWSGRFSKGMDKMEHLIPQILLHQQIYDKELSDICLYLIFRFSHIATCYPWINTAPVFMAKATAYIVFVIPLKHPYNIQEPKNFPSPPLKSTVPEIIMHSPSKDIAISSEFELSNVDSIQTSVPYIVSVKYSFINNLKWLWGILIWSLQNFIVRFLFNTIAVFIRLYILLFAVLLITFVMARFYLLVFSSLFVDTFLTVFRFPNLLLCPLTLSLIHMELQILEFLLTWYQTYLHIFYLTLGINCHHLASKYLENYFPF